MPRFLYRAVNAAGELVDGEMEAADRDALVHQLRRDGFFPLRTSEPGGRGRLRVGVAAPTRRRRAGGRLALFLRELSTLLGAGLPLDAALTTVARQSDAGVTAQIAQEVLDGVRGGAGFADALERQSVPVPGYVLGLLRAGEAGGTLQQVLDEVADMLERAHATEQEIRAALNYPILVVLATGISLLVLLVGVVPEFEPLFEDAGDTLPLTTRAVLAVSQFVRGFWWLLAIAAVLAVLILPALARHPRVRDALDGAVLGLPLLGPLVRKREAGRFCRTLGTLLANGVQIVPALDMSARTFANQRLSAMVSRAGARLRRGEGLAEPLAATGALPRLAVELMRVGEASSQLDRMLLTVAGIFEEEVRRETSKLIGLLVPIATLLLGVLVAAVIGSILSAILSSYDVPF